MMNIITNEDVVYNYNEEKKELFFLFSNDNHSLYTLSGWFGRRFWKFLKDGGNLKSLFKEDVFKENKKLREVFQSLTATLIQQGLLCSSSTPPRHTPHKPLNREEWLDFGVGNFRGCFSVRELLAYADGNNIITGDPCEEIHFYPINPTPQHIANCHGS